MTDSQNFRTIKSHLDAYEVAKALEESLAVGESVTWNCVTFRRLDEDYFSVSGYVSDRLLDGSGRFVPSELADVVLFPERRQFNDYIRSRILPAQAKALAATVLPFEVYEENAAGFRATWAQAL